MGMTREEKACKEMIQEMLSEEGYPTYASLLKDFDINLTTNPKVIGFMEPNKGRIVINRTLDADQISVVIRHEILHQYLDHEKRLLTKLAKEHDLDYDSLTNLDIEDLTDLEVKDLQKESDKKVNDLKRELYGNKDFNYAADYEISNRAYTEKDKEAIRNINLGGEILTGLVTEDQHPDWVDLTVEEMYDKIRQERINKKNQPNKYYGMFLDDSTFVDINTGVQYGN